VTKSAGSLPWRVIELSGAKPTQKQELEEVIGCANERKGRCLTRGLGCGIGLNRLQLAIGRGSPPQGDEPSRGRSVHDLSSGILLQASRRLMEGRRCTTINCLEFVQTRNIPGRASAGASFSERRFLRMMLEHVRSRIWCHYARLQADPTRCRPLPLRVPGADRGRSSGRGWRLCTPRTSRKE